MKIYDIEKNKSKVITWLVRDVSLALIPKGYSSFDEICDEIRKHTSDTWEESHNYILSELEECTKHSKENIDYQLTYLECLQFPYYKPVTKNITNKDYIEIIESFPSKFNSLFKFARPISYTIDKNALMLILHFWDDILVDEIEKSIKKAYSVRLDGFRIIGDIDFYFEDESVSIFEIPLIEYYRSLLELDIDNRDQRCLLLSYYNTKSYCSILFSKITFTELLE
ncbi:hypothetical protein EHQ76_09155 [Leptospira barantonii]|uniref:Uncharacterized protein n=1 Tax=Leptospira barantonii TaxID=2023184 RepID=A0A5F2BE00_9LEPT|nr:hypothetical protein [Leptospira barantonii]TGM03799.1 hypothetical protein EHQ76_09155 [Leptospira barantonii]